MKKLLLLFVMWPMLYCAQSTLFTWNKEDLSATISNPIATQADNISVSPATALYATNSINYTFYWYDNVFLGANLQHNDNLAPTQYVQFKVQTKSNYTMSLSHLNFDFRSFGTIKFQVRASKDVNFENYFVISGEKTTTSNWVTFNESLANTGVVKPGEILYIRIYIYANYNSLQLRIYPFAPTYYGPSISGTITDMNNKKPDANDDNFDIDLNYSKVLDILNNDSYASLSGITITTPPAHGKVVVNGTTNVTYIPDLDYVGTDSFTYKLNNANGNSSAATVNLNILQTDSKVLVRWESSSDANATITTPTYYNPNGIKTTSIDGFTAYNFSANTPPLILSGNYWIFYVNKWHQAGNSVNPNYYMQYELETDLYHHARIDKFNITPYIHYQSPQYYEVFYSKSGSFSGEQLPLKKADGSTVGTITSSQATQTWLFPEKFTLFPGEKLTVRVYAYAPTNTSDSGLTIGGNTDKGTSFHGTVQNVVKCSDHVIWNGNWSKTPNIDNSLVILDSDYSGDNFEACSVLIKPGKKLTINSGKQIKVNLNIINQGDLEIQSDANLFQTQDDIMNGGATLGNSVVKRNANLKRNDYNYWGTPVIGQNLRYFSIGTLATRFYTYNESNDGFNWIDPYANKFTAAKGYAIRAPNTYPSTITNFEGKFIGAPNNGIISIPITKSADTTTGGNTYEHGFNLISNPYPSDISFEDFYTNNSTVINKAAYFWTNINPNPAMQYSAYPNGGYINNYAILNGSGGVPAASPACNSNNSKCSETPTDIIKVGQGFIVQSKVLGTNNITFNNAMRKTSPTAKFFNRMAAKASVDRFWLKLTTPLDFENNILIAYKPEATNDYEIDYDAPLLVVGTDSFYSVLEDKKLAIQGRQYPLVKDDVVTLGASFYADATYTISIANKEGIFAADQPIYLKDKYTGVIVDLSEQNYSFSAKKGVNEDRFEIIYYKGTLSSNENNSKNIKIYQNSGFINIESPENINKVSLYDYSGKIIYQLNASGKTAQINSEKLSTGAYVVNLETINGKFSKKILKK